jgi:putative redox protein
MVIVQSHPWGADLAAVWQAGDMATDSTHRSLTVERVAPGRFEAVNSRGGRIAFGTGGNEEFTPTELLLIAIGGCTAIDVDILTSRRSEPESFEIAVDADKVRDENGNHLANIEVTYKITFPAGEDGDKARAVLPDAARRSHERLCTVGRTVELPSPISMHIV